MEEEETVEGEEAAVVHDDPGVQLRGDAAHEGHEHTWRRSGRPEGVQEGPGTAVEEGGVYVEEVSAAEQVRTTSFVGDRGEESGIPGDALSTFEVQRGRSGPEQGRETGDVDRSSVQQPDLDTAQCGDEEEGVAAVGTGGDDVQPGSSAQPMREEPGEQVPPVGPAEEWETGVREPDKAADRGETDGGGEATAGGDDLCEEGEHDGRATSTPTLGKQGAEGVEERGVAPPT